MRERDATRVGMSSNGRLVRVTGPPALWMRLPWPLQPPCLCCCRRIPIAASPRLTLLS